MAPWAANHTASKRRSPFNNWGIKLVSLLCAAVLWFFVVGEEKAEIGVIIPVELINIPSNLMVVNDVENGIDVRVNGPRSLIRQVANQKFSKTIDLSRAGPGMSSFPIGPETLSLPRGVRVMRVRPTSITIFLERIARKTVTVQPVLVGDLAPGYSVSKVTVEPVQVTVSGPASELAGLTRIWSKPIDVSGLTSSVRRLVGLDFKGYHLSGVADAVMEAHVEVEERVVTREFRDVPIRVVGAEQPYTIEPPRINLLVMGSMNAVRSLEVGQGLDVTIDVSGLKPGNYTRKALIKLPLDTTLVQSEPKLFEVAVSEGKDE
ncbi:MAG: CdaR family protein [Pseudomonadota bacterium]